MAIISFKCPNCGGELIFDPATQKYKCEYCNSLFTQEELDAMKPMQGEEPEAAAQGAAAQAAAGAAAGEKAETEQTVGEQESEPEGEAVYYSCPSCGAEIVTDATTAATFCYYCHNPVVLGKRLEGSYLPNKIIPFEIGREDAEKKFLDFVSKKKYVPKAFFNKKQIESMTGVYFPYWGLRRGAGGKDAGRREKRAHVDDGQYPVHGDQILCGGARGRCVASQSDGERVEEGECKAYQRCDAVRL